MNLISEFFINSIAPSTLLPWSLTTKGTLGLPPQTSLAASMMPWATVAQLTIPPKMLTRIPSTLGSELRILKAATTWGVLTPPPRSKKFAGSPPWSLMMSMVAIASPAPLTRQAMLPSRLMKFKSNLAASTSNTSSWEVSRWSWISFWRNSAFSSNPTLASTQQISSLVVSMKGLTSTMVQSHLMKVSYNASMFLAADSVHLSVENFIFLAISMAWPGFRPVLMSTGSLMIAEGSSSAMSSMVTPPLEDPIMTGPPNVLSMRIAKYFSLFPSTDSTIATLLQMRPAAPVCLVISLKPIICLAMS
mmetsp:Transcript_48131/g.75165  ORF Transcript_48131/g.75165 Transcript_48131/m.75165 type:complete len:304 (-) Transcript_48131:184-1095(-)